MDKKALFLRTYANLPVVSRDEIIAVVRDEPFTWKSAKLEIEEETEVGAEILESLFKLSILTEERSSI
jgi:hypothetical protein